MSLITYFYGGEIPESDRTKTIYARVEDPRNIALSAPIGTVMYKISNGQRIYFINGSRVRIEELAVIYSPEAQRALERMKQEEWPEAIELPDERKEGHFWYWPFDPLTGFVVRAHQENYDTYKRRKGV